MPSGGGAGSEVGAKMNKPSKTALAVRAAMGFVLATIAFFVGVAAAVLPAFQAAFMAVGPRWMGVLTLIVSLIGYAILARTISLYVKHY